MELHDLAWAGPAGAVLTWGLVYLFSVRRRSPRAVGLALTAIVVSLAVYATEALFFRRLMTEVVIPNGGLLGLTPGDTWTVLQGVINTVKAGLAGLLIYAVALDRRPVADD